MKEVDIQESIVLANTLRTFTQMDDTREVLAYNPQWGSFLMTPANTKKAHDIRFADAKRGDLLLCKRIERVADVEYSIEKYLTLENIERQFVASQKQK